MTGGFVGVLLASARPVLELEPLPPVREYAAQPPEGVFLGLQRRVDSRQATEEGVPPQVGSRETGVLS